MNISEMEKYTGLAKQNIRFYEKKGLLHPSRNKENGYREYEQNDLLVIKEIILYRKLGITIEDIKLIMEGKKSVDACLKHYYNLANIQISNLKQQMTIYRELNKDLEDGSALNVDKYLDKIENLEQNGISFFDNLQDYVNQAKDTIYKFAQPKSAYWFEPEEPILNTADMEKELKLFAGKRNMELSIIEHGMEPEVEIDRKRFIAMAEQPHTLTVPRFLWLLQPFFNQYRYTYGFRFVYLYQIEKIQ